MSKEFDIELPLLLEAIHSRYSYDFRQYALSSLKRRLAHAMDHFQCRSLSGLQERVLREPEVMHELLAYLTVQVSEMFRDPSFYRALREKVVPYLMTYPSLKVWIPGCATGEEVYSLAILLREEGLLDRTRIYATDINPEALRGAEAGIYELERMAGFSKAYREAGGSASLADYYTAGYDAAIFDKTLREGVLFSDHSLATDSVFAEVQLITCRNVLIYFDSALQDRALALFRDSLCRKGLLGLGAKETLAFSGHAAEFTDFVREERIYQEAMIDEPTATTEPRPLQAVLIGGSAGALEVVSLLLAGLPCDFAPAIAVVIHQPRRGPSTLVEALRGTCTLPLREAQDKEPLAASTVYLAPPDYHLLLDPGPAFSLSVDEPVNFSRPSIDVLFESSADTLGPRCAGILVSGANPDGARGLRAIQEAGGLTVVQAPQEAAQRTMPEAALAICPGARVLPANGIRQWLSQFSATPTPASESRHE